MPFTPYIDTLGQFAFDYLVEEVLGEIRQDSEFNLGYDFNESWIDRRLTDYYADYAEGWNELDDDQKYQVVLDVKEQVAQCFDTYY